jgi:hypothetical protein
LDLSDTLPWKTSALIFASSSAIIQIFALMNPSTLPQIKESGGFLVFRFIPLFLNSTFLSEFFCQAQTEPYLD